MECESMWFVKNHIPDLWDLSNSFSNSSIDFYSCEGFHQLIYQKEWSIKLRIDNGGWYETLNLLHLSRCEILHLVTSYMKQNKSRKQTLESAQYGLEISFKLLDSLLDFVLNGLHLPSSLYQNATVNCWKVFRCHIMITYAPEIKVIPQK